MNSLKALVSKIILVLAATVVVAKLIFPSTQTEVSPTNNPTPTIKQEPATSSAIIEVTLIPTKAIPIILSNTPTPTKPPTQDPQKKSACESASMPVTYFNGISCLPSDPWWRGYTLMKMSQESTEEVLDWIGGSDRTDPIKTRLVNVCAEAQDKPTFENCNQSLRNNADRFKNEILSSGSQQGRINDCLSQVDTGDNSAKEHVKELFWRTVMNDNLENMYRACYQNSSSLNNYSF